MTHIRAATNAGRAVPGNDITAESPAMPLQSTCKLNIVAGFEGSARMFKVPLSEIKHWVTDLAFRETRKTARSGSFASACRSGAPLASALRSINDESHDISLNKTTRDLLALDQSRVQQISLGCIQAGSGAADTVFWLQSTPDQP